MHPSPACIERTALSVKRDFQRRIRAMTIADLLQLPAGVLAATATLLAGLVAATTVILSSVINARTARIVARDTFRRQILYDSAKPFLERLNGQIAAYERYIETGPLVSAQLRGISKTPPDVAKATTEAALTVTER